MKTLFILALGITMAACQTTPSGPARYHSACTSQENTVVGTIGGALLGGLVGSQIGSGSGQLVATGAGAVVGAGIGNNIGSRIRPNRPDCSNHPYEAERRAISAPVGSTVRWDNYQTNNTGSSRTINQYRTQNNTQCREFVNTVQIGGRVEQAYGTACLQPDGSWRIIK